VLIGTLADMAKVGETKVVRDRSTVRNVLVASVVAVAVLLAGACGNGRQHAATRVLGARVERSDGTAGAEGSSPASQPASASQPSGTPAGSPAATAVLSGTVIRRGDGVAGVQLTLRGPDGLTRDATADPSGRFRFVDLPAGAYNLVALDAGDSKPSCNPGGTCIDSRPSTAVKRTVTLATGALVDLRVEL